MQSSHHAFLLLLFLRNITAALQEGHFTWCKTSEPTTTLKYEPYVRNNANGATYLSKVLLKFSSLVLQPVGKLHHDEKITCRLVRHIMRVFASIRYLNLLNVACNIYYCSLDAVANSRFPIADLSIHIIFCTLFVNVHVLRPLLETEMYFTGIFYPTSYIHQRFFSLT